MNNKIAQHPINILSEPEESQFNDVPLYEKVTCDHHDSKQSTLKGRGRESKKKQEHVLSL